MHVLKKVNLNWMSIHPEYLNRMSICLEKLVHCYFFYSFVTIFLQNLLYLLQNKGGRPKGSINIRRGEVDKHKKVVNNFKNATPTKQLKIAEFIKDARKIMTNKHMTKIASGIGIYYNRYLRY